MAWFSHPIICMEIIDLKIFRGPNNWSVQHKELVELTIDLGNYKNQTSNNIPGFEKRLKQVFPSFFNSSHEFFQKIEEGVFVEEVILYVIRELQLLTGTGCVFYKTESVSDKSCIVFS